MNDEYENNHSEELLNLENWLIENVPDNISCVMIYVNPQGRNLVTTDLTIEGKTKDIHNPIPKDIIQSICDAFPDRGWKVEYRSYDEHTKTVQMDFL